MTGIQGENLNISIGKPQSGFYKILKLVEQVADESGELPFTSADIGIGAESLKNYIKALNDSPNSIYLVAYKGENPVGFGYLEGGKRERTYHSTNLGLGVLEDFSNQGIGSKILKSMIQYAQESESIAKIDLQVRRDNAAAIKLYKKYGFEAEGVNKRALFIEGRFYDYINMGMLID